MPLFYVLWSVALLTIIASATLGGGSLAYRQARNVAEAARQEALTEAAVNRAVLGLLDPRPISRWRVDGAPITFDFNGTAVTVTIQDELGRVDLNHADSPLVIAALRAGGLPAQAASETADKILDWRDNAPAKRLYGAKAAEYASAGLAHLPRNGPFQSVDELGLVLGMTPRIFARVEPLLTVWSGRPRIDPQFAPRALLAVLSGQDGAPAPATPPASPMGPGVMDTNIALDGRAFSIRVTLGRQGALREAVIRVTTNPARPYWLLSWRPIRTAPQECARSLKATGRFHRIRTAIFIESGHPFS